MHLRRRVRSPRPARETREEPRPIGPSAHHGRQVLTIQVDALTTLPPQRVLEAGRDFSDRRADVWPNVRKSRLTVHESGEDFAEVTEGTWVVGLFWERNRYDWSKPGSVKATVIDSSIFQPGSTWELRATAHDGGSQVQMVIHRSFRNGPKGTIASAVHHTVGKWVWRWFLRSALAAVEKQQRPRSPGGIAETMRGVAAAAGGEGSV
jgi:hypothetical protein